MGNGEPDYAARRRISASSACALSAHILCASPTRSDFIKEIAGTNAHFQTEDIDGQLKRAIVTEFSDAIGEMKIPALDLAAQYKEFGEAIRGKDQRRFQNLRFRSNEILRRKYFSLPPEVEEAIDKRCFDGRARRRQSLYAVSGGRRSARRGAKRRRRRRSRRGSRRRFCGRRPDGKRFRQGQQGGQGGGQQTQTIPCPTCGKANAAGTKFCADCGGKMEVAKVPCVKCGAELREGAKFCSECGSIAGKSKMRELPGRTRAGRKILPRMRNENRT